MYDYSYCESSLRTYAGFACAKAGIIYEGKEYLVKLPNKLKDKLMKNVEISYANDTYSEYIASHVMNLFIPAHETTLGLMFGKVCVLCKDFTQGGYILNPYQSLKTTLASTNVSITDDITDGKSSILSDVKIVIESSPLFQLVPNAEEHFWVMFIIDALNGNSDRNNGNWGVLADTNKNMSFAPIYDNGNSLSSKMSDKQMATALCDDMYLNQLSYKGFRCYFTNEEGSRVNPFNYIKDGNSLECTQALKSINLGGDVYKRIEDIVDSVPDISDVRRNFYKTLYKKRLEKLRELQNLFCENLSVEEMAMWSKLPETIKANYTGSKRELLKELDL